MTVCLFCRIDALTEERLAMHVSMRHKGGIMATPESAPNRPSPESPEHDLYLNLRDWRPLFSERLAMSHMGPIHRRLHIAISRFHFRVSQRLWPSAWQAPSRTTRAWFWLWRQYRRTWDIRP